MSKYFWKHFTAVVAALAATATLLTVLFNFDWIKNRWLYGTIGATMVLVVSLVYAYWQSRSNVRIELNLNSELKLTISKGDLFEKKGVICVPVNEYFDTHVGDGVIDERTIHGIFINKYYKDRVVELENKIQNELSRYDSTPGNRRLDGCPNKKYELGTCIDIRDGENTYVLFAFTHFNENDTAFISRADYSKVIHNLMQHLNDMVESRPVYIPLFGTGLSRIRRTPQRVLFHLIDLLDFDDSFTIPGGLNIIIKKGVNVNLTIIEDIVKNGIS